MRFQTSHCPLCSKSLKFKSSCGVKVYYCATEVKPHYEVETDGKITIQHIYAFPYAVDNYAHSSKSRLYKWRGTRWGFVKEVPEITPHNQDALLSHLKSIMPPTGTPYPSAL